MKVSQEKINSTRIKITIETKVDNFDHKINKKLTQIQKNIKMDGFRKGKVPLNIIKNNYFHSAYSECLNDLISHSYQKALENEKLQPISSPKLDIPADTPIDLKELKFSAQFDIYPQINLNPLDQLQANCLEYHYDTKDLAKQLEQIRQKNPDWIDSDEKAKDKDALDIVYQLTLEGKKQLEKPSDLRVIIGSKTMIEGFEEQMIGLTKGNKKEFELTFPKNYSHEHFQNKLVKFEIEVKKVQKPKLPSLDDEFAKKLGVEKGIAELKVNLEKNIQNQAKEQTKNYNRKQIIDALLKANDFEIPISMIQTEQQSIYQSELKKHEQNKTNSSHLKLEDFHSIANQRVKISLLFHKIIEQFELKQDEQRYENKLLEIAKQYSSEDKITEVKKFYDENTQQKQSLIALCLEEQVIDFIADKANINFKQVNFEQLMNYETAS